MLSVGIDPEKSVVYLQSAVKEIAELFLLLGMMTPLGWLERVPTFKEQQAQLADRDINTFGFLGYPLLQTVDIIIMKADTVPVGEDQVFHLELAREIVRRFNGLYGDCFPEPQPFLTPIPKLPGVDGRKMSKSYGNAIYLGDPAAVVDGKIRPMVTDVRRKRRSDPGVPTDCPVFALHKAYSKGDEIAMVDAECRTAGHRLHRLQEDTDRQYQRLPGTVPPAAQPLRENGRCRHPRAGQPPRRRPRPARPSPRCAA